MRGSRSKRIRKAIGLVILALLSTARVASAQGAGRPDTPALDFKAHTLGSQPVVRSLANYKGNVLLVVMWATWCTDCRSEMTSIQKLYAEFANRGFRVAAVSVDRGSDQRILAFARALGLTFDILRDEDGEILRAYLTQGVPTAVLIDRHGIIRRRNLAIVDWDAEPRRGQIESLLAEPDPTKTR
jgi:cytochrome c biogenesis protein CcmG, thiol:disulfide interchange protein DsbE